jgi:hypothetical protein
LASATEALSENEKLILVILCTVEIKGRKAVSSSDIYEVLVRYLTKRGEVIGVESFYNLSKRINMSVFLKIKRESNPKE